MSPTLAAKDPFHRRLFSKFSADINPSSVDLVSIYMCFLTGLTASPSFAACFVWCGFQTGNAAADMAFRCDAGTDASHDGGGIGGSLLRRVRFIKVGNVRYLQLQDLLTSPY